MTNSQNWRSISTRTGWRPTEEKADDPMKYLLDDHSRNWRLSNQQVENQVLASSRARKAGSFFISFLVCGLRLTHEGWGARSFNFDFLI